MSVFSHYPTTLTASHQDETLAEGKKPTVLKCPWKAIHHNMTKLLLELRKEEFFRRENFASPL